MIIIIKTLTGRRIFLNVEPLDKIENIKEKLEEEVGFPPNKQTLIFNEMILENDKTISFYEIKEQSVINFKPVLIDEEKDDENNTDEIEDFFGENKDINKNIENKINIEENNIINTNIVQEEEKNNVNEILIENEQKNSDENFFIKTYLKKNELYVNLIHFDLKMSKTDNYRCFNILRNDVVGCFQAIDDLIILQNFLDKMKDKDIPFIVITSGSSGKDVIEICSKYQFIKEIIIFCFDIPKHEHYINEYPGYVKKIFKSIKEISEYIKTFGKNEYRIGIEKYLDENKYIFPPEDKQMEPCHIISSYEYDKKYYFLVHKIYSDFFGDINNKDEISLFKKDNLIKMINYLSLLNFESDNEKNDLINKFTNLSDLANNNQFIEQSIKEYASESNFRYIFNRKLKDFEKWIVPYSYFMGPFLYGINKYVKDNPDYAISKKMTLYKIFKCSKLDFYEYKYNLGHLICLTSLTSTSPEKIKYDPKKYPQKIIENNNEKFIVKMIFTYSHKKGNISPGIIIGDKKIKNGNKLLFNLKEKEVLLFPFTVAKICGISTETENKTKIQIIKLEIINRQSYYEYTLKNDFENRILFDKLEAN